MKQAAMMAIAVLVAACGAGESDEVSARDDGETIGTEIASDYNRQMNKARDVELQLQDHKRDLDATIERQTDPDQ